MLLEETKNKKFSVFTEVSDLMFAEKISHKNTTAQDVFIYVTVMLHVFLFVG